MTIVETFLKKSANLKNTDEKAMTIVDSFLMKSANQKGHEGKYLSLHS